MNKLNFGSKATGDKLTAAEFNKIPAKVNEIIDAVDNNTTSISTLTNKVSSNANSKFGYHRIVQDANGDNVLQEFANQESADMYDKTQNASLLLSSLTLPSSGGGSGTGISYYLRCVNNLSSLAMSVAKNDECDINFTFISKYKYPDDESYTNTDEHGKVEVYVQNSKYTNYTLMTAFEVASNAAKSLDIHEYLENGTNTVKVLITGYNTNRTTAAIIYTVQVTSMSLSAPNFAWYTP